MPACLFLPNVLKFLVSGDRVYYRLAKNHDCLNFTMFAIYNFSAKLNPSLILSLVLKNVSMRIL